MTSKRPYLAALYQKNSSCLRSVHLSSKYFFAHETDDVTLSPVVIFLKCLLHSLALRNVLQAKGPYRKCPLPPSNASDIPMTSSATWWIVVLVTVVFWWLTAATCPSFCCKQSRIVFGGGDSDYVLIVVVCRKSVFLSAWASDACCKYDIYILFVFLCRSSWICCWLSFWLFCRNSSKVAFGVL
jgi:hypothetical protein